MVRFRGIEDMFLLWSFGCCSLLEDDRGLEMHHLLWVFDWLLVTSCWSGAFDEHSSGQVPFLY